MENHQDIKNYSYEKDYIRNGEFVVAHIAKPCSRNGRQHKDFIQSRLNKQ